MNPTRRFFVVLFSLSTLCVLLGQSVNGYVSTDSIRLPAVLVMNMTTQYKVMTDAQGAFEIPANVGDELRFVRKGYERGALRVTGQMAPYSISLVRVASLIEEVDVSSVRLTGDLTLDSKRLARVSAEEKIQAVVGLPQAPEKPREHAYTSVGKTLLPMVLGNLNVHALYQVISGEGRRKKSLYEFEDLQTEISWVKDRVAQSHFTERGIPVNRIQEFLSFAFSANPKVRRYAKAKNLSGVLVELEDPIQTYVKRLTGVSAP